VADSHYECSCQAAGTEPKQSYPCLSQEHSPSDPPYSIGGSRLRAEVTTSDLIVLQGEIPIDGLSRAIELANHRVVLNLAPVVDLPSYLLSRADPLIVNEHEGRLALGVMTGTDPDASLSDEDVLQRLIEHGVRSVIMTRGEQGALVADRDGLAAVPSPKVKVVDTTGAGDAFVGATVAALAEGSTLIDAARFAARVGAYACTGRGAQPSYPDSASPLPDQRQGAL
ncbi:PfkB family carbohydrate kinase, partial [Propioniciclava sp. MC1683]|uniref:PfkB family carbohydrate kinase n=1 Tax=Propioniciclava sp. MC1683 TaxID=2760309 RepID=UPI001C72542F